MLAPSVIMFRHLRRQVTNLSLKTGLMPDQVDYNRIDAFLLLAFSLLYSPSQYVCDPRYVGCRDLAMMPSPFETLTFLFIAKISSFLKEGYLLIGKNCKLN